MVPILSLTYNGSRHDSTTIKNSPGRPEKAGFEAYLHHTRHVAYSKANLELLYEEGFEFPHMCVPRSISCMRSSIR